MSPSILLDDAALTTNFNFLGNTWTRQTGQSAVYNGTLTVWNPGSQSFVPPELYLFYYGSDINFYGTMTSNLAANYTIDGTTRRPVPFPTGVANGKTGINLFSLSGLTEGFSHTLEIFPSAGQFTLDYVTYTPNSDTLLSGVDLILDDGDAELKYSAGEWNHTTGDFKQGRPYNGTMTGTNVKGATMQLSFEGSDISVYGLLNQVAGRLSASFVVDGQNASAANYTPFDGQQVSSGSTWNLSQQFFHKDLTPGQHTLLVTVNDVSDSQMLWIDSVVFEGTSLTTLAGPSSSSGSGGTLNPGFSFPKAAIGGIAVGAFFFVLCLLGFARCRRRRPVNVISTEQISTTVYAPPQAPVPVRNTYYDQYEPPMAMPTPPPPPQQDGSNSSSSWNYTPHPPPPAPGERWDGYNPPNPNYTPPPAPPAAPRGQWDGSNPVPTPNLNNAPPPPAVASQRQRDGASPSSDSVYTPSSPTPTQAYYPYGEKGLVGLQWGAASSVSDAASSASQLLRNTSQGATSTSTVTSSPAAHSDGWTPPAAWASTGVMPNPTSAPTMGGAGGALGYPVQGAVRGPTPVNHAHEDGRDDDGETVDEPRRETDVGPAELPPSYNDQLYQP